MLNKYGSKTVRIFQRCWYMLNEKVWAGEGRGGVKSVSY